MRKTTFLAAATVCLASFYACTDKQYDDYDPGNLIGDWGVVETSHDFGLHDSLFYLINPILNISDSIYYNGNYTDSYYHADSTRVMLRYTTGDSIYFYFDRMYAVQTNPDKMLLTVMDELKDSVHSKCKLRLAKVTNSDRLYSAGTDSLFKELLRSGKKLHFAATNATNSYEAEGSQNYDFVIFTQGFDRALDIADSLNFKRKKVIISEKDTLNHDKHKIF